MSRIRSWEQKPREADSSLQTVKMSQTPTDGVVNHRPNPDKIRPGCLRPYYIRVITFQNEPLETPQTPKMSSNFDYFDCWALKNLYSIILVNMVFDF